VSRTPSDWRHAARLARKLAATCDTEAAKRDLIKVAEDFEQAAN